MEQVTDRELLELFLPAARVVDVRDASTEVVVEDEFGKMEFRFEVSREEALKAITDRME